MPRAIAESVKAGIDSGLLEARIEVIDIDTEETLLSTDPGMDVPQLKVIGGETSMEDGRQFQGMGRLKLSIPELDISQFSFGNPLSPVANSMVQISYKHHDHPETSDWGRYDIGKAKLTEGPSGVNAELELYDNSRKVERISFYRPGSLNATSMAEALWNLIAVPLPHVTLRVEDNPHRIEFTTFDTQADRLAIVQEMVVSIGFRFDWNWNGRGDVLAYPEPDANATPVWSFTEGGNAVMLDIDRELSDEKVYNGVVAMGEATGSDTPPVMAEVWDLNPNSVTYFDPNNPAASKFGAHPFFYVSKFITTEQQAKEAASARLPKVSGMTEVIALGIMPNPGIVPGDAIELDRPRVGAKGTYIVDSNTLPHGGRMGRLVCKERRLYTS